MAINVRFLDAHPANEPKELLIDTERITALSVIASSSTGEAIDGATFIAEASNDGQTFAPIASETFGGGDMILQSLGEQVEQVPGVLHLSTPVTSRYVRVRYAMQSVLPLSLRGGEPLQRLTLLDANSGTFTLTFLGETTAPISFDADTAAIQTALEALPSVGEGNVTVTMDTDGTFLIEFDGSIDAPLIDPDGSDLYAVAPEGEEPGVHATIWIESAQPPAPPATISATIFARR